MTSIDFVINRNTPYVCDTNQALFFVMSQTSKKSRQSTNFSVQSMLLRLCALYIHQNNSQSYDQRSCWILFVKPFLWVPFCYPCIHFCNSHRNNIFIGVWKPCKTEKWYWFSVQLDRLCRRHWVRLVQTGVPFGFVILASLQLHICNSH